MSARLVKNAIAAGLIKPVWVVYVLGLVYLTARASVPMLTDVLQLDGGPVRGIEKEDMRAYLGIPYAAPPGRGAALDAAADA
jgi:hypothetical protein